MYANSDPKVASRAFLESIPGLNVAVGLAHMEGDMALYLQCLLNFAHSERSAASDMASALAHQDKTAVIRRAHTVKGLAGTLGAEALQHAAKNLEFALRDDLPSDAVQTCLAAFESHLHLLVEPLSAYSANGTMPLPRLLRTELETACRQLLPLLIRCEPTAGQVLDTHANLFKAGFPAQFSELAQAVHDGDYEIAESLLLATCLRYGLADPAEQQEDNSAAF